MNTFVIHDRNHLFFYFFLFSCFWARPSYKQGPPDTQCKYIKRICMPGHLFISHGSLACIEQASHEVTCRRASRDENVELFVDLGRPHCGFLNWPQNLNQSRFSHGHGCCHFPLVTRGGHHPAQNKWPLPPPLPTQPRPTPYSHSVVGSSYILTRGCWVIAIGWRAVGN